MDVVLTSSSSCVRETVEDTFAIVFRRSFEASQGSFDDKASNLDNVLP